LNKGLRKALVILLTQKKYLFVGFLFASLLLYGGFAYFHKSSTQNVGLKPIFYNFLESQPSNLFLAKEDFGKIELPELITFQKNTLYQVSCSQIISGDVFASLIGESNEGRSIKEYIVEQGDTISSISQKFDISVDTILWANDLTSKSLIKPGQKLIILPTSGVMHFVKKGDTISELARIYKVESSEIINYNGLSQGGKIYIGDILIIPGAKPPQKKAYPRITQAPIGSNYFICPILPPCRITQGLHWYNAVDFGHGTCGDPVLAAAGGTIQKTGYHSIAGNYIRVLHPNGVVTFYGHLSKIAVVPGQKVSQGEIIGYIGHTGYTIPKGIHGCHLHFEVRGARNPFASY